MYKNKKKYINNKSVRLGRIIMTRQFDMVDFVPSCLLPVFFFIFRMYFMLYILFLQHHNSVCFWLYLAIISNDLLLGSLPNDLKVPSVNFKGGKKKTRSLWDHLTHRKFLFYIHMYYFAFIKMINT